MKLNPLKTKTNLHYIYIYIQFVPHREHHSLLHLVLYREIMVLYFDHFILLWYMLSWENCVHTCKVCSANRDRILYLLSKSHSSTPPGWNTFKITCKSKSRLHYSSAVLSTGFTTDVVTPWKRGVFCIFRSNTQPLVYKSHGLSHSAEQLIPTIDEFFNW